MQCPNLQSASDQHVQLIHGEGGLASRRLLERTIAPILGLSQSHRDAGIIDLKNCAQERGLRCTSSHRLAITTDSFVVSPLMFPGGDIGSLAVYGTVNDLAVSGAVPIAITLSLILEEGLSLAVLEQILRSIRSAAERCSVSVAAGDTKVVRRGEADQLFINTTGLGVIDDSGDPETVNDLSPRQMREGDVLVASGPIGRHGIAILAAREQLGFQPEPRSDCAPLIEPCKRLRERLGSGLRTMRDATRGGTAAVCHEWSASCSMTIELEESRLPVSAEVKACCELLGLDPLYIAGEGIFVAAVAPDRADEAVELLRSCEVSREPSIIGTVQRPGPFPVVIRRMFGGPQPLIEPAGSPLPRIC